MARNRKWDGQAHWVVPGLYLGEDIHGWWIFQGTGEFCSRPGAAFYTASDVVLLVPREGEYVATFYDDSNPGDHRIYVDMATAHEWKTIRPGVTEFHMIDMDLDVIRSTTRGVFIDDKPAIAEAAAGDEEFPSPTFHDLRHTAVSLAISSGSNVKVVQRIAGHASATLTLDTYAGLFDDDLHDSADRLNERLKTLGWQ